MITKTKLLSYILFLILICSSSCSNNYNNMLKWANELEQGLSVEEVKKLQPSFLEINWEDPRIIDDEKWYFITDIDWNWDPLAMSNFLVFKNNRYVGRDSHK